MKASLYHIQINVSDAKRSLPFYRKLFSYLDYKITDESDEHTGFSNGATDFWIIQTENNHVDKGFHRKATGLNHISFRVSSKDNVDIFVKEFLVRNKIKPLYESPKQFPHYKKGYYAVFFEDPDRIKLEIAYVPDTKTI